MNCNFLLWQIDVWLNKTKDFTSSGKIQTKRIPQGAIITEQIFKLCSLWKSQVSEIYGPQKVVLYIITYHNDTHTQSISYILAWNISNICWHSWYFASQNFQSTVGYQTSKNRAFSQPNNIVGGHDLHILQGRA